MRNLILAVCLCAAAAPALAQSAPPPSPEWVAAALRALADQRNGALDQAASLRADLDAAQREIAALKKDAAAKGEPAK